MRQALLILAKSMILGAGSSVLFALGLHLVMPTPSSVPPAPSRRSACGTVRYYDQGSDGGFKPAPPA